MPLIKNIDWILLLTITTIVGLFYFNDLTLLAWSLLWSWVVCNCVVIILHEGLSHQQVIPKSKLIGYLLEFVAHLIVPFDTELKKSWSIHWFHHATWKSHVDHVQNELENNSWFKYLCCTNINRDERVYKLIDKGKVLPSNMLDQYHVMINVIFSIALILLIGITNYFYFYVIPVRFFDFYLKYVLEYLPHHGKLTKEEESDTPWLFPICLNGAYHTSHHKNPGKLILGPLKYLNIQYYFIKLFYNINTSSNGYAPK